VATGELQHMVVSTNNGPAFTSLASPGIADWVELEHVRTRHYAHETNGVVEYLEAGQLLINPC
jgi:hypothetical protein